MSFWEQCVYSTYHAHTFRYHSGRRRFVDWLTSAAGKSLVNLRELETGTLGTIVWVAGTGSPLNDAATAELVRRSATADEIAYGVLVFQRPVLDDWFLHLVLDRVDPGRRFTAMSLMRRTLAAPVAQFWSRFYLLDVSVTLRIATSLVNQAFREWEHLESQSFFAGLLERVFSAMPRVEVTGWPTRDPDWWPHASAAEQRFIRAARTLEPVDRLTVFACVYMNTTAIELAAATARSRPLAPRDADAILARAWRQLFQLL